MAVSYSSAEYLAQLRALLPRGWVWICGRGYVLYRLLSGMAPEFARVDQRLVDLRNEADPLTILELLPEWERLVGIPDPCAEGVATTLAARRAAVQAKLLATGGASRQYFIDYAAALGYPGATIDEFRPMGCNDTCNDSLWSELDRFVWMVNLPGDGGCYVMTCNDTCNDYLQVWGETEIECRINRLKPAHTVVVFAYTE